MIIGIFLVIIGVFWLLSSAGVIVADLASFIWPTILIALGIQILYDHGRRKERFFFGHRRHKCNCTEHEEQNKEN